MPLTWSLCCPSCVLADVLPSVCFISSMTFACFLERSAYKLKTWRKRNKNSNWETFLVPAVQLHLNLDYDKFPRVTCSPSLARALMRAEIHCNSQRQNAQTLMLHLLEALGFFSRIFPGQHPHKITRLYDKHFVFLGTKCRFDNEKIRKYKCFVWKPIL